MSFKKISDVVDKLKVVTRFGSNNYSSISRPSSVDKYLKQSEPTSFWQNELRLQPFKNEYLNYIVKKTELKRSSSFNNFTKIPTNITANYAPLKSSRWFYGEQIANQRKLYEPKDNFKRRLPPNPKPLKSTQHLPLYTYKKFTYSKKKIKNKHLAKMDMLIKKIYYGRIINNYFYKSLAKSKAKHTEIEKNMRQDKDVLWPSLYRYKGPPVKENLQKHLTESTANEESFKNINSMTAPNTMHFKTIKVAKDKTNIESKEFFKNLNRNTKPRKDLRVRTFAPGLVVKHEHMYQPLYMYKGTYPGNKKKEPNLVKDVNVPTELDNLNKLETAKDTVNIKNETLTMKDTEYFTKVNERNKASMNLPPIKQADSVKNNILDEKSANHVDPVSVELRNPFPYQKNSTDLNAQKTNETSKLEQHLHAMKQNQNISSKIINNAENIKQSETNKKTNFTINTKKNSEIYKIEQQINSIKQNQNIANKAEIKLPKSMNQMKSEPSLQNSMAPNPKRMYIQRNAKVYGNSLNNTRVPQGGPRSTGSNRRLFTSAVGRNFTQINPSLLGTFTCVNNFSTSTRNLDKRSYLKLTKVLNYLVKLVKINDISNNSKIPSLIKPYPEKRVSKNNWLHLQRVAQCEPIKPTTKSRFYNEEGKVMIGDTTAKEMISAGQTSKDLSNNSTINKEPESKVSSNGQQTTATQPISKEIENKKEKRKLILDGPLIWRCEKVLSQRYSKPQKNLGCKKEIQRGTSKKPKNLVYSSNTASIYDPLYFCKNKTYAEKLNSDYLQNKSKRITHNVQRSKSDYSLYRFPYNESKIGSNTSKNNVDSIRVNYICTAQNKMHLNGPSNSPIDSESSNNLPNEDNEKVLNSMVGKQDKLKDDCYGNVTLISNRSINNLYQYGYYKPSFPDLVLQRNKTAERTPFYHDTSILKANKSIQTTFPTHYNHTGAEKSSKYKKCANDVLKNILEKITIKHKQLLFNKHPPRLSPNKPFPDALTITSAGIAFPLNIKLKQKPKINKYQYNSNLSQCPTLEADKNLNSFLLYNRNINDYTRSQKLSANDKRSRSAIKDSRIFPKILFPKPMYSTISAGIGLPQKLKIPPKPSSSGKTPKKCIKENDPGLKENLNFQHHPEFWKQSNPFLNNQNYLIYNESSRNKKRKFPVETVATLGTLLIENQKKNQELLTSAIINPNYLYRGHCLSAKASSLSKMKDNKKENEKSSQLNSFEQSSVNFEPNKPPSKQQTSLNNTFKEEILNSPQFPFGALYVHTKTMADAEIKNEATKENNNNGANELQESKLQNRKVKLKETSPSKSLTDSKEKQRSVVDSQPMLLKTNSLNTYVGLSPSSSKKKIRKRKSHENNKKSHEENKVHPDLAKLLKNGNGIVLKTDKNYQDENKNGINELKYLAQHSVIQKKEEQCNLKESEVIHDTNQILNEENKCSEQLKRDDEFPENTETMGKHNLNMPEQNSFSSNKNKETILPTETRNPSELINSESKGKEDLKLNIGTQTINKLFQFSEGLKLPKLMLNCEKSWYTEQMSCEKKLLLLQISKEKIFVSK